MSGRVLPTPWLEFVRWCRARGLRPLPAHPWTIAAYARWCEHRHRYPSIAARIRAIARIHLLKCASFPERHPTVQRTLTLIEARDRGRAGRSDLFDPDTAGDERPAEGAKRRRREPVAEAAPADAPRQRRRRPGVALRATPRLVSRRPRAR